MNSLAPTPTAPHMSEWAFVDQFKKYQHTKKRKSFHASHLDTINLSKGVNLEKLPDENDSVLETAYQDFSRALNDLGIPEHKGNSFRFEFDKTLPQEAFKIDISRNGGLIRIADIEAGRRAVYFLMDEIISCGGSFLPIREYYREPFVKTRISRCYYGPKKRPPLSKDELLARPDYKDILANDPEYRDELIGDFDYYPDAYLSRLAHDGINGLWIIGYFNELCKSEVIPEYGEESEKRLKRLQEIVKKCARYGIKIYIFCMEPSGFGGRISLDILGKHPELKGNYAGNAYNFCTSSEKGKAYLEEACYYLFSQVPELGGLINLCVGERPTNCCSGYIINGVENHCPRCSKRKPAEVIKEVLEIMQRGMKRVSPEAKLIAWPYSQYIVWGEQNTVDAVDYIPEGVTLIHNFESRGRTRQLNKTRVLDDYWLAYPGPSQLFKDCAHAAIKSKTDFGAKIQTCCSYELATVPFVPVPGILYKKYKAMRELHVSTVMQCWLIGSCPSVMTQAAGMLSFEDFPESENEFLLKLAAVDWGKNAAKVASAWEWFQRGYENYPYSRLFSYYSPMNAGVVWPLFLIPQDKELYPPFRANRPPCGDRIGECLGDDFTLAEAITLCEKMTVYWDEGLKILNGIAEEFNDDEERRKDIGVANAVGIHIKSTYNILSFYDLREKMAWSKSFSEKIEILGKLEAIVIQEIENTQKLKKLSEKDSRLGFQADSECHIYFPMKLQWRLKQLEELMENEFPEVKNKIRNREEPFPEYTGKAAGKYSYECRKLDKAPMISDFVWENISSQKCGQPYLHKTEKKELLDGRSTKWQGCYTSDALYVLVSCDEPEMSSIQEKWELPNYMMADCVELIIEKQRLWPSQKFVANAGGDFIHVLMETEKEYLWSAEALRFEDSWRVLFKIPWKVFGFEKLPEKPLRLNVRRIIPVNENSTYASWSWCGFNPLMHRLLQPPENPAEFGWLKLC
jgi:hypothetical protein